MKTTRDLQILLILIAMVLPIAGCGGEKLPPGMPTPVPCEIVVMQEGQPLEGAMVRLLPADGGSWDAIGRTDASGKAVVYVMDKYKGAIPGKYKVIVNKIEQDDPGPVLSTEEYQALVAQGRNTSVASFYLVEEQYRNSSKTTLEIEVVKGTPVYTVDIGKAVRIKIIDGR